MMKKYDKLSVHRQPIKYFVTLTSEHLVYVAPTVQLGQPLVNALPVRREDMQLPRLELRLQLIRVV
jgi:hypothetical protein